MTNRKNYVKMILKEEENMAKFCQNCGSELNEHQDICLKCGVKVKKENSNNIDSNAKSKMAAGLFGIFLGAFGVHNFYLGFTGKAVAQLLITVLSCGFLWYMGTNRRYYDPFWK